MSVVDKKFNFLKPIKTSNLIRLGRDHDGGYIVDREILKDCENLISFGVGEDWSFELDFIKEKKNIKIHIYDYSVSIYPYLKELLKYLRRFLTFRTSLNDVIIRFKKLKDYIRLINNKNITFFKEKISFPSKKNFESDVDKVFSRISQEKQVFLKCDIEGSEYEIIDQILKYYDRIEMLIFEFHNIDKNEIIFLHSVKKIQNYFHIIHIHGNNHDGKLSTGLPITIEMTLINKKKLKRHVKEFVTNFPVEGLDKSNNPNKDDLKFSFSTD